MGRGLVWVVGLLACAAPVAEAGHGDTPGKRQLQEVIVTAEPPAVEGPFLADVEGARLYAGKKTTVARLNRLPAIQSNNYRQAAFQVPGLLVSEQHNRGHVNFNYRGIGDPHETQDLLVLKDGVPIVFERFGYSTLYYHPPLEVVDHLEVVRGGGNLLYGPQPGPTLNYVTVMPPEDRPLTMSSQHVFGSHGSYSTLERFGGTQGPLGYAGYLNYSESDGPRTNEGFGLLDGGLKLVLNQAEANEWVLQLDAHEHESEEPGRVTLAQYLANRKKPITPRPFDRLTFSRYAASLSNERTLGDQTWLSAALYGGYTDRFSLRRTSSTSTQNNLDRREATTAGGEVRLRHDYEALGETQTLTVGSTIYAGLAPRSQDRGATGIYPSKHGTAIFGFDYRTLYGALFGEHRAHIGELSILPAFRLDLLSARVQERFNTGKTSPLHDINELFAVPLFGLGIEYELGATGELYANMSQGYKPPQFDDLAPAGNNTLPATSLDEGRTWTYEAGMRGKPTSWAWYDASVFVTDYDNVFGTVTAGADQERRNIGRAIYYGYELGGELDLIGLLGDGSGSDGANTRTASSLNLVGNATLLSAEFEGGPLKGREPAYAPNYLIRVGPVYRWPRRLQLALQGTMVEGHFWADDNQPGTTGTTGIPSYAVWDVTGEVWLWKESARLVAGINNLLDEAYFSRVRSDGIEPALRRNYYLGFSVAF